LPLCFVICSFVATTLRGHRYICFSPHPRVLGTSGGSRVLGIKFL
jgi:hypothetical protein